MEGTMVKDRVFHGIIGITPLLFAIAYLWNPWGRGGTIIGIVLYALAVWAAVKNPLKGKPRSALAICVGYGLAATVLVANAFLQHTRRDLGWAIVFIGFAVVWGINSHRDAKLSPPVIENHG